VTTLTSEQIGAAITQRIRDADLSGAVNRELSQFLSFPEGYFVEVVLNDASTLPKIEQVLREYTQELHGKGIELDAIVRAIWKIREIQDVGSAHAPDGGALSSREFKAVLAAGELTSTVSVRVPITAMEELLRKLGNRSEVFKASSKGLTTLDAIDPGILSIVVKAFLEAQLAAGGTGYWDPIRHPIQELNEAAVLFLLGQSSTFDELLDAIDSAFTPPVLEVFLADLSATGIRMRYFDQVLPQFSNLLGGAYSRGQIFSTSASDMFSRLRPAEQHLIWKYFENKVARLDPSIKKQFSTVFA